MITIFSILGFVSCFAMSEKQECIYAEGRFMIYAIIFLGVVAGQSS